MKDFFNKVKEFVKKHKIPVMIGAVVFVVLVIILLIILFNSGSSYSESMTSKVRRTCETYASAEVKLSSKAPDYVSSKCSSVKKVSSYSYEVHGTTSYKDKYGNSSSKTFDGTCSVEGEDYITCDIKHN